VQIAAAQTTYFAVHDGGRLVGWGTDGNSELGDDRARWQNLITTPVDIDAGDVAWVRAGPTSASGCARTTSGTVLCWGRDDDGQIPVSVALSDGSAGCFNPNAGPCVSWPQPAYFDAGVSAISLAVYGGCAVTEGGAVKCFGTGLLNGESGTGPFDILLPLESNGHVPVAVDVAYGAEFACALLASGGAMCWGKFIGLGRGVTSDYEYPPLPVLLPDGGELGGLNEIQAGYGFACARAKAGEVYCWGDNAYGQLGDPTAPMYYASKVPIPP
jgi:alpha-tubulin suppressor-like RCC1 family protein